MNIFIFNIPLLNKNNGPARLLEAIAGGARFRESLGAREIDQVQRAMQLLRLPAHARALRLDAQLPGMPRNIQKNGL